jgi:glycosyltransferase involved in cell wall biosynthesis
VHFLGWQRDPSPFLKAADILVCPTDEEPLGNVVLEGWNADLPVVATASPGPSWLIEHGKTGLLSPCGDVEGLVENVQRLIDVTSLKASLIIESQNILRVDFSSDSICERYISLELNSDPSC